MVKGGSKRITKKGPTTGCKYNPLEKTEDKGVEKDMQGKTMTNAEGTREENGEGGRLGLGKKKKSKTGDGNPEGHGTGYFSKDQRGRVN